MVEQSKLQKPFVAKRGTPNETVEILPVASIKLFFVLPANLPKEKKQKPFPVGKYTNQSHGWYMGSVFKTSWHISDILVTP